MFQQKDLSSRTNSPTLMPTEGRKKAIRYFPSTEEKLSDIQGEIRQKGVTDTGDQHTYFTLWSQKSNSSQTEIYKLGTSKSCPHWERLYSAE